MPPAPRLVILPISPWSERARWALDHHGLAYRTQLHIPFLGERKLRRLVGPDKPRATVPVLVTEDQVLTETWDIVRWADSVGQGEPLIPAALEPEIRALSALADDLMATGRALISAGLLASPEALDETLPPSTPRWLRPLLRPVTRYGSAWFARKYQLRLEDGAAQRSRIRESLHSIRARVQQGRPWLLGDFSYADIVIATGLQGIGPVADRYIPLGPAMRRVWTQPALAEEFADLLAWRDRLYAEHRGERRRRE